MFEKWIVVLKKVLCASYTIAFMLHCVNPCCHLPVLDETALHKLKYHQRWDTEYQERFWKSRIKSQESGNNRIMLNYIPKLNPLIPRLQVHVPISLGGVRGDCGGQHREATVQTHH